MRVSASVSIGDCIKSLHRMVVLVLGKIVCSLRQVAGYERTEFTV